MEESEAPLSTSETNARVDGSSGPVETGACEPVLTGTCQPVQPSWHRRVPTGGIVRLLATATVLIFVAARQGVDQAVAQAPVVANAVDVVGRWFRRR